MSEQQQVHQTSAGPSDGAKTADKFSAQQILQYEAYEKVRRRGAYNMFDPRARKATGLSADAYVFVMENFGALRDQCEKATGAA